MNTVKLSNVSLPATRAVILSQGYAYSHTRGDHEVYVKPGALRPFTLPCSKSPVAEYIVKNFQRDNGISRKDFTALIAAANKGRL